MLNDVFADFVITKFPFKLIPFTLLRKKKNVLFTILFMAFYGIVSGVCLLLTEAEAENRITKRRELVFMYNYVPLLILAAKQNRMFEFFFF